MSVFGLTYKPQKDFVESLKIIITVTTNHTNHTLDYISIVLGHGNQSTSRDFYT